MFEKNKELSIFKNNDFPKHKLYQSDNLIFLKEMIKNKEKVDIIYIDPPYNTKKKFNYNDNYKNWDEFMEQRIKLAHEILNPDGFLFISIDDYSFASLKIICDKIFEKDNQKITPFIRKTSSGGRNSSNYVSANHDYVLVYKKGNNKLKFVHPESNNTKYPLSDEKGVYKLRSLKRDNSNKNINMNYEIINPETNISYTCPEGWRWKKNKVEEGILKNIIVFKEDNIYIKEYKDYDNDGNFIERKTTISSILDNFPNSLGTNRLKEIFDTKTSNFSYAKPVELIEFLIKITNKEKNIKILDFFAGSGTTGEAVMKLNEEDKGNREFILCTNNENNICLDITFPRLIKVIQGYSYKNKIINGLDKNNIDFYNYKEKDSE